MTLNLASLITVNKWYKVR